MADVILTSCNVARSWHWFRHMTAPCNVACGSGIVTVNSPSGSTLQCDRWLWDDMPLNSPKRPLYWNSTSGFDFHHFTALDMSFCTSLWNFIQIGPPSAEENDAMSIFQMADLSHICLAVSTEYRRVSDGRRDGRMNSRTDTLYLRAR